MSVTVVSQYWKHKLLAAFRILLITGIYVVTALLLSNQNAGLDPPWPAGPPKGNETDTPLVLPAACLQGNTSAVDKTLVDTFGKGAEHLGVGVVVKSTPGNHIVGWNFFILMILWYGAAIIAEAWRYWLHWYDRRGRVQGNTPSRIPRLRALIGSGNKWIGRLFWVYQAAGTIFCIYAIVKTFLYIQSLRRWMDRSPWLKKAGDGMNPENDATSFGQLVPLLLILLTVFTTLQLIGGRSPLNLSCRGSAKRTNFIADKFSDSYHRTTKPDPEMAKNHNALQDTSSQDLPEKKDNATVQVNSVPPTPLLGLNGLQYQSTSPRPPYSSVAITPTTTPKPPSSQTTAITQRMPSYTPTATQATLAP